MSTIAVGKELLGKVREVSERDRLPANKVVEIALEAYLEKYPQGIPIGTPISIPKRGRPFRKDSLEVAYTEALD